jgi:hypothetical protein
VIWRTRPGAACAASIAGRTFCKELVVSLGNFGFACFKSQSLLLECPTPADQRIKFVAWHVRKYCPSMVLIPVRQRLIFILTVRSISRTNTPLNLLGTGDEKVVAAATAKMVYFYRQVERYRCFLCTTKIASPGTFKLRQSRIRAGEAVRPGAVLTQMQDSIGVPTRTALIVTGTLVCYSTKWISDLSFEKRIIIRQGSCGG